MSWEYTAEVRVMAAYHRLSTVRGVGCVSPVHQVSQLSAIFEIISDYDTLCETLLPVSPHMACTSFNRIAVDLLCAARSPIYTTRSPIYTTRSQAADNIVNSDTSAATQPGRMYQLTQRLASSADRLVCLPVSTPQLSPTAVSALYTPSGPACLHNNR